MLTKNRRIAIFSRPGGCFPNIIAQGLSAMLNNLGIDNKIFYNGIPFLMRLLPLTETPKRWDNSLHFRIYNKIRNYKADKDFINEINLYDIVVIAECLPNALWHNYLAIERFRQIYKGRLISYSDGPISSAPLHKKMLMHSDDASEERYDYNWFLTDSIEFKYDPDLSRQAVIGLNLAYTGLTPVPRKSFKAVVDFEQPGYESYRQVQLDVLNELGIETVVLNGRYAIEEIRKIYSDAAIFFMSFPETFGMPIAECLSCGTGIFTPDSSWPMIWRLNEDRLPWGQGTLPNCFHVYHSKENLKNKLQLFMDHFDPLQTPFNINEIFLLNYRNLYSGDENALKTALEKVQ
jgi:hypothetical protein